MHHWVQSIRNMLIREMENEAQISEPRSTSTSMYASWLNHCFNMVRGMLSGVAQSLKLATTLHVLPVTVGASPGLRLNCSQVVVNSKF